MRNCGSAADSGAGEVVVLRLSGPLAGHSSSVVVPFLLPDIPVVAWWPDVGPGCAGSGSVGPIGNPAYHRCNQRS